MKLIPFNAAHYVVPGSLLVEGAAPSRIRITTLWCALVRDDGVVLVDTGVDAPTLGRPGRPTAAEREADGTAILDAEQRAPDRLARVGIGPEDVRVVVNTHLHVDHVGWNRTFPGAAFACQQAEIDYARDPGDEVMAAEYPLDAIALDDLPYMPVDGDVDLFGDGTVRLLSTPGHTKGHQSILVRLRETGPVLLTGDAIWTSACLDEASFPSLLWSRAAYAASRRRLIELSERTGARLLHSHDPETFGAAGWVEGKAYS